MSPSGDSEDVVAAQQAVLGLVPRNEGTNSFHSALSAPHVPNLASAMAMRDSRLKLLYDVLPTPEGAEAEALRGESSRRRPALKSGGSGKGARDVAIWLTTLDAARGYPGNVYSSQTTMASKTTVGFTPTSSPRRAARSAAIWSIARPSSN